MPFGSAQPQSALAITYGDRFKALLCGADNGGQCHNHQSEAAGQKAALKAQHLAEHQHTHQAVDDGGDTGQSLGGKLNDTDEMFIPGVFSQVDGGAYAQGPHDEQGYKDYSIGAGYGPAQAGVQFEAGKYGVFTSSAEVTLTITRKKADNEQYTLKDGEDTLFLTFEEGDTIQVESEESDFDSVYLMEWED